MLRLLALFLLPLALSAEPVEVIPAALRGRAAQPQIAFGEHGRVHVVFGSGRAIFHTTSADGRSFSAPVKVGELDQLALGLRRGPRLAVCGSTVLVTAISHADGDVHCWRSPDDGQSWLPAAPLNSERTSAREGLHAMAGDGHAVVAVVWLDVRATGKCVRGRFSRDAGATWSDDTVVYQSPDGHVCECCTPNVTVAADGTITAMWRNWLNGSRDLYVASSRDGGRTFGPAQKLGEGTWPLQGCPMDGGGLASSGRGDWLAVWRRERTIFASTAAEPERRLAENSVQAVAAYAGQTPVIVWETNGSLMMERGTARPERFAEKGAWAAIGGQGDQAGVVWESGVGKDKTIAFEQIR
jgi:hypothetical protein